MGIFSKKQPALRVKAFPPAPQIGADFVPNLLSAAGYPASDENLYAATERVVAMLRIKGVQFIESAGTPADVVKFKAVTAKATQVLSQWPQQTVDALVAWDGEVSEYIQDLPAKIRKILLESKNEPGGFFNGGVNQPLVRMENWA